MSTPTSDDKTLGELVPQNFQPAQPKDNIMFTLPLATSQFNEGCFLRVLEALLFHLEVVKHHQVHELQRQQQQVHQEVILRQEAPLQYSRDLRQILEIVLQHSQMTQYLIEGSTDASRSESVKYTGMRDCYIKE
jgi:chaperonin GroEL (HSP60 family)